MKIIMFSFPIMAVSAIELYLPETYFGHRSWEGLQFRNTTENQSNFYPNRSSEKIAYGDLCYNTEYEVQKTENWKTDFLGFRNNDFIYNPDIILVGQSFIAGSALSQQNTLTNKILKHGRGKVKVYSMAPATMSLVDHHFRNKLVSKPKMLVYSLVERNLPEKMIIDSSKAPLLNKFDVFKDRIGRFYSIKHLCAKLKGSHGNGVQSKNNRKMFFLRGSSYQKQDSLALVKTVSVIKQYNNFCIENNILFVFVPMPDKENVYSELVPMVQSNYLNEVHNTLTRLGIHSINTLEIYNKYRNKNDTLLYHLDDTHWNKNATELISKKILQKYLSHNW